MAKTILATLYYLPGVNDFLPTEDPLEALEKGAAGSDSLKAKKKEKDAEEGGSFGNLLGGNLFGALPTNEPVFDNAMEKTLDGEEPAGASTKNNQKFTEAQVRDACLEILNFVVRSSEAGRDVTIFEVNVCVF